MAAKKTKQNKSTFIRSQSATMSTADVIAKGKAHGLKISSSLVNTVRSQATVKTPPPSRLVLAALDPRLASDSAFDAMLPDTARTASMVFWTPVMASARAAAWLVEGPHTTVLDVGSGVGKFCIIGAALTGAFFVGVEQRGHLVQIAQDVARRTGVDCARFIHGKLDAVPFDAFDAFYLYNPFYENVCYPDDHMDETVTLSEARFIEDVAHVRSALEKAPPGTRVVTCNGYGGQRPRGYQLVHSETLGPRHLDLWVKGERDRRGRTSISLPEPCARRRRQ